MFNGKTNISVVMSDGDNELVCNGTNGYVTELNIEQNNNFENVSFFGSRRTIHVPIHNDITISMIMKLPALNEHGEANWQQIFYSEKQTKTIKQKKVDDCTIEELLFACKKKMEIRNGKKN